MRFGAGALEAEMKILTGNSNRPLAEAISAYLNLPLVNASIRRFSDMEVFVEIQENVRGEDMFVVQPTSFPTNDNVMELLVILDALKRSFRQAHPPRSFPITAIAPGPEIGAAHADLGQAGRQPDQRRRRQPVLTVDLHAGQIQGFFDIPTDNRSPPRS